MAPLWDWFGKPVCRALTLRSDGPRRNRHPERDFSKDWLTQASDDLNNGVCHKFWPSIIGSSVRDVGDDGGREGNGPRSQTLTRRPAARDAPDLSNCRQQIRGPRRILRHERGFWNRLVSCNRWVCRLSSGHRRTEMRRQGLAASRADRPRAAARRPATRLASERDTPLQCAR